MSLLDQTVLEIGESASTDAYGVAVVPTKRLSGVTAFNIDPGLDIREVPELRGSLYPRYRTQVVREQPSWSAEGHVIYEEFVYWLAAIFDDETVDTDIWTYNAPSVASDSAGCRVNTYVYGDTDGIYGLPGGVAQTLNITIPLDNWATFTCAGFGKAVSTDTFAPATDNLAFAVDTDVTFALGHQAVVSIDPGSDAVGTTPTSDMAFSAELAIMTNREPKFHLGEFSPTGFRERKWDATLVLHVEVTSTSEAYIKALLAATAYSVDKNIQIKLTSGSYSLQIDFGGVFSGSPTMWEDEGGILKYALPFNLQKTSGMTVPLVITVVNAGTALV